MRIIWSSLNLFNGHPDLLAADNYRDEVKVMSFIKDTLVFYLKLNELTDNTF